MIKVLFFVSILLTSFVHAEDDMNSTASGSERVQEMHIDKNIQKEITELINKKKILDSKIKDNNIWSKIYSNYHTFRELEDQKELLDDHIHVLEDKYNRTESETKALELLKGKQSILIDKLQLLKEYEKDPFKKFLRTPNLTDIPTVENPLEIISAISYMKKLKTDQTEYESKYASIQKVMDTLKAKELLLKKILFL